MVILASPQPHSHKHRKTKADIACRPKKSEVSQHNFHVKWVPQTICKLSHFSSLKNVPIPWQISYNKFLKKTSEKRRYQMPTFFVPLPYIYFSIVQDSNSKTQLLKQNHYMWSVLFFPCIQVATFQLCLARHKGFFKHLFMWIIF